jgi:glycosyltransferase involved in cell wall biosynthesis
MKKPTLLHCINSLCTGGAELLLRNTIPLLKEFDHVICYLNKPDELLEDFKLYPVYCLDHSSWSHSFRTIRKIRNIISSHKVDLLHSHLFDITLLSRLACPSKTKFAFTLHSPLSQNAFQVNRLSLIAEKLTYRKKHTVISVSNSVQEDYNDWVGIKGQRSVLYNYVKEEFFNLENKSRDDLQDGLKLVAVGSLRRAKNYFKLIEAISLLKNEKISLDIYGEGGLRGELQKAIDAANVNIQLKGKVPDVSKVLLNYDAYIMPSIFEGFGIAPMEAIAAGMPVLLSDLDVFKEVAADVPVYFNPHDAGSIAKAIADCRNNWKAFAEKAKSGRSLVYAKSSKQSYSQNLKNIYSQILNPEVYTLKPVRNSGSLSIPASA